MKTDSVVTRYSGYCALCGKPTQTEHHLLFGIGIRELAEEDGIKIPVCDDEHNMSGGIRQIHNNSAAEKLSKIAGQLAGRKNIIINYMDMRMIQLEKHLGKDMEGVICDFIISHNLRCHRNTYKPCGTYFHRAERS